MFLTPLPRTFFAKVQFFFGFGLVLLLGMVIWPFVALYDFIYPEKTSEDLDYTEEDSYDDPSDKDKE